MTPTPITCNMGEKGINYGVYWAAKKLKYSINRPGMNDRLLSEALDDKIMGDIATLAVLACLNKIKVSAIAYDEIRKDDFRRPDPGWDIAIGPNARDWGKNTTNPSNPEGLTTISIKSSRLPQNDTLNDAIKTRDFKIFKYRDSIKDDIAADLEVQVYYDYHTTVFEHLGITKEDDEINNEFVNSIKDAPSFDITLTQAVATKLNVQNRWGSCSIVGYNDKDSMVADLAKVNYQDWRSSGKLMWTAPLRFGKNMSTLINYT